MKASTELILFAAICAILGWIILPEEGEGSLAVFVMGSVAWIASRICSSIEKTGE